MKDKLKRLNANNFFKQWTPSDFTSGISFRTGSLSGPLILEIKPSFSQYGVVGFGKNLQASLFNIPCDGVLFDDGLFVVFAARPSTNVSAGESAANYGFNVNIFYSGGS